MVIGKVNSEYEQFIDKNSALSEPSKAAGRNRNSPVKKGIEEEDFLNVEFM